MIEITAGSLEEHIIRVLQKIYPITTVELAQRLHVSRREIEWMLQKFQVKGIVKLEPLPDKTYVRLLRNDFQFMRMKHQRKPGKQPVEQIKEDQTDANDIMYS
jgi:predicted ArsR family transcriptional regulator